MAHLTTPIVQAGHDFLPNRFEATVPDDGFWKMLPRASMRPLLVGGLLKQQKRNTSASG